MKNKKHKHITTLKKMLDFTNRVTSTEDPTYREEVKKMIRGKRNWDATRHLDSPELMLHKAAVAFQKSGGHGTPDRVIIRNINPLDPKLPLNPGRTYVCNPQMVGKKFVPAVFDDMSKSQGVGRVKSSYLVDLKVDLNPRWKGEVKEQSKKQIKEYTTYDGGRVEEPTPLKSLEDEVETIIKSVI